jgi:hypothetical protein
LRFVQRDELCRAVVIASAISLLTACTHEISVPGPSAGGSAASAAGGSGAGVSASGGAGSFAGDSAGGSGAMAGAAGSGGSTNGGSAGAASSSPLLPARIRRLTNAEYDRSVQALLGTSMAPSVQFSFPPDARQGPTNSPAGPAFTVNDAQRVDPVLADKLDTAALALVAEARSTGRLAELAPCAEPAGGGEACAREFLQSFGARAFRRALSEEEVNGLVSGPTSAYHVGADGYTHEEGIEVLARVLLQSPGFLYITELGEIGSGATFALTPDEIATQLSYLLTSGPPDAALLERAGEGALATADGREAEARRLLDTPAGQARFVRVVQEWLGIDEVARREKASSVYPEFASVSQAMEDESHAFIDEVLHRSTGTLTELLTADWTIIDAPLAELYGVTWPGAGQRTSLGGVPRRGILNQAAFLSVFASNNGSHPVFRGVALMRRIACLDTPDPGALGIVVSFPAADPQKTTRERFSVHTLDPACAGCHATIDAFGFSMENFDGIGKLRTMENALPVETSVTLATGSDIDGTYADSTELLAAVAQSDAVKACLARQIFRSSAARSNESVAGAENAFVEVWRQLPAEAQERLPEVLVAYVKSRSFLERRAP